MKMGADLGLAPGLALDPPGALSSPLLQGLGCGTVLRGASWSPHSKVPALGAAWFHASYGF